MSISRGADKEDVVRIHIGTLLSHLGWNNAVCSNTDEPRDYHSQWSKSERERQIPYDTTYMKYVSEDGYTYFANPASNKKVARPTIHLTSTVVIKSGSGTKGDPFVVGLPS